MNKNAFNAAFRAYVKDHLTPKEPERKFVAEVYASVQQVIGATNSLQIGSFPRYTAITPLHDLDVLCVLGAWDTKHHNPAEALADLERRLRAQYKNPTKFDIQISRQTHSVTISFRERDAEVFGVDIVPAYVQGQNEFGEDTYVVPEIAQVSHAKRQLLMEAVAKGAHEMGWIATDPRGYIAVARQTNDRNEDFRKAVKLAKGWRCARKDADNTFPLKSFHLEQAITTWVRDNPNAEIFDMVFEYFRRLPDFMRYPQFPDRADPTKNIDDYVSDLTEAERRKVIEARDGFLVRLENFEEGDDVGELLSAEPRKRASAKEEYLFDQGIPILTDATFSIKGEVQARKGGFKAFLLNTLGRIQIDRAIRFSLGNNAPNADVYKWKVKNDDDSPQPRGEITDHRTLNEVERTAYEGHHYVECFAVRNGVCVGRSRQNVVLEPYGRVTRRAL